ncbi:hypothetical protein CAL26_05955 [Bordetella genomosp. 9]|uniref:Phage tail protein n=1 Tax=Bordetella genomosp. 9 TaxID=1416803 RepID=A0A261RDI0_9BORD|nr:phage tail protein [Bordetella genomosp. 9]OZI23025.1 hypothetical protein CAL26_05955 [Bordetella genomosp. 9]
MLKPNSLRAFLTDSNSFLKADPDRLLMFVDEGRIVASGTLALSHEYRYTLNLIVTDYPGAEDALLLPLLAWLRTNQPELFENPELRDNAIPFDVDLNNNQTVDISIKVALTERVIVTYDDATQRVNVAHVPEPVHPALPDQGERRPVYLHDRQIATMPFPVGNP